MKVRLAYGRSGLETDFPDDAVVVAPEHRDAAADQSAYCAGRCASRSPASRCARSSSPARRSRSRPATAPARSPGS